MATKTVYIVGYEGNDKLATSGFNWYPDKAHADADYNETKEKLEPHGAIVYRGELQVTDTEDRETITSEVEKFLENNDWENAFNETKS